MHMGELSAAGEFALVTLTIGMSAAGSALLAPVYPAAFAFALVILVPCLLKTLTLEPAMSLVLVPLTISYVLFLGAMINASARLSAERSDALSRQKETESHLRAMHGQLQTAVSERTELLERQQMLLCELMQKGLIGEGSRSGALRMLARKLCVESGSDRCGIWLLNADNSALTFGEVYLLKSDSFVTPPRWDSPERIKVMLDRSPDRVTSIDDLSKVAELRDFYNDYCMPLDIRSSLQAPILRNGNFGGFVTCSSVGRRVKWSSDQKLLAASIANLAALVIERHERLAVEKAASYRAELLTHRQDVLNSLLRQETDASDNPDDILARLSQTLHHEMMADRVTVRLATEGGTDKAFVADYGPDRRAEFQSADLPPYHSFLTDLLLAGPIISHDCAATAALFPIYESILKPKRIRSLLSAPILIGTSLVGFISCCNYDEPRQWTPDDVIFVTAAANIIALDLERRRRQQVEHSLEQANQVKSQFLAHMSHEIRTPLNGIFGMTELLKKTSLNDRQMQILETVERSSKQLVAIVNDVLDVAQIEKGALKLEYQEFDLGSSVETAVNFFSDEAKRKGLSLECSIDESLRGSACGDPIRIRQVLVNLLSNSIKFTAVGTVSVRVGPASPVGSRRLIRFEVRDTGIGIDSAVRSRLFQPFAQGDSSLNRRYGGTGLGLTISQQLVELMGGEIGLESTQNRGTIVWFTLPLAVRAPSSARLGHRRQGGACHDELKLNILVAEDNPVNQIVAQEYLEALDCSVTVVENGALAVAAFEVELFDLILMDCQMPEMDGLEATCEIRRIEKRDGLPQTPIIAVTAHARQEDRAACLTAGMNDFISKPYSEHQLAAALKRWSHPALAAGIASPAKVSA